MSNMGQILTENFDLWSHLSTFRVENTRASRPSNAENNKNPEQFQNNFEKVQK